MNLNEYSPKIRARAKKLASKLYEPKSLDLSLPENQKNRDQIAAVLELYCEQAQGDLKGAAREAEEAFYKAKQAAIDAARMLEAAKAEAEAAESDVPDESDEEDEE